MMRESAQERNWDLMLSRLLTFFSYIFLIVNFFPPSLVQFLFFHSFRIYTCIRDFYYMMIFFLYFFFLLAQFLLSLVALCRARHSFIHFSFRLENIEYVSWAWDGETCVVVEPPILRWLFKFCLLRSLCVVFFLFFLTSSACVQFRFWAHVRRRPDLFFGEKRKSEGIILYVKKSYSIFGPQISAASQCVLCVLSRE